jgi:hypothetical protein
MAAAAPGELSAILINYDLIMLLQHNGRCMALVRRTEHRSKQSFCDSNHLSVIQDLVFTAGEAVRIFTSVQALRTLSNHLLSVYFRMVLFTSGGA